MDSDSDSNEFTRMIQGLREGSQQAARELIENYSDSLLRFVRRKLTPDMRRAYDSHDFLQATWEALWRHRSRLVRFKTRRQFTLYLGTMATNNVRWAIRRRGLQERRKMDRDASYESLANECPGKDPTGSQVAIANEVWCRLIDGQPAHYQKILQLTRLGKSCSEVADILGMNAGHVRRILQGKRPQE